MFSGYVAEIINLSARKANTPTKTLLENIVKRAKAPEANKYDVDRLIPFLRTDPQTPVKGLDA